MGSRRHRRDQPITRRAPDSRAHAADFHSPWKSSATSYPCARSATTAARAGPEAEASRGGDGREMGQQRVGLEQGPRRGLHDPADLPSVGPQGRGGGKGMDDVADGREADDEGLHRPVRARAERTFSMSRRVSWSLGSPTMATRPP